MPTVLFEANETTMDNLMEDPLVRIEESASRFRQGPPSLTRLASTNMPALSMSIDAKACRLKSRILPRTGCRPISRQTSAQSKTSVLSRYRDDGCGAFDKDFDLDVFKAFVNLRKLITMSVSFGPGLPDLFPNLETWLNMDWRSNPVKALDGKWTNLANLSLQGFSGRLSAFDGAPIRRLFLVASSIKDIEEILRFEKLEALQIVS